MEPKALATEIKDFLVNGTRESDYAQMVASGYKKDTPYNRLDSVFNSFRNDPVKHSVYMAQNEILNYGLEGMCEVDNGYFYEKKWIDTFQ